MSTSIVQPTVWDQDELALAAAPYLNTVLSLMAPSSGIISLGPPKVLGSRPEFRELPLQIYEKSPRKSFNYGHCTWEEYGLRLLAELETEGWNTRERKAIIVYSDVSNWPLYFPMTGFTPKQYLFLLDTCSTDELNSFYRECRRFNGIPDNSIVMLNTCEVRNPGSAERAIRKIFNNPCLVCSFPYLARGAGGQRFISFWKEGSNE